MCPKSCLEGSAQGPGSQRSTWGEGLPQMHGCARQCGHCPRSRQCPVSGCGQPPVLSAPHVVCRTSPSPTWAVPVCTASRVLEVAQCRRPFFLVSISHRHGQTLASKNVDNLIIQFKWLLLTWGVRVSSWHGGFGVNRACEGEGFPRHGYLPGTELRPGPGDTPMCIRDVGYQVHLGSKRTNN